jgi:hypothetical protein
MQRAIEIVVFMVLCRSRYIHPSPLCHITVIVVLYGPIPHAVVLHSLFLAAWTTVGTLIVTIIVVLVIRATHLA